MAKTVEQLSREALGSAQFQLIVYQAEIEKLREDLEKAKTPPPQKAES